MGVRKCVFFLFVVLSISVFGKESVSYQTASKLWDTGNTKEALGMFEHLAENGSLNAAFILGVIYQNGFSVPRKDHVVKAIKWFRFAAERGHSEAQNKMGAFYYSGNWWGNVKQDLKKSAEWYRLSAEQGHTKSQYRLGNLLCWFGQTVEGYAWLTVAIERGDAAAKGERQRICKGMTPAMISSAKKRTQRILGTQRFE